MTGGGREPRLCGLLSKCRSCGSLKIELPAAIVGRFLRCACRHPRGQAGAGTSKFSRSMHTHTQIYIYIYTHMHTYIYTHTHIYIYIHMYVWYVCVFGLGPGLFSQALTTEPRTFLWLSTSIIDMSTYLYIYIYIYVYTCRNKKNIKRNKLPY